MTCTVMTCTYKTCKRHSMKQFSGFFPIASSAFLENPPCILMGWVVCHHWRIAPYVHTVTVFCLITASKIHISYSTQDLLEQIGGFRAVKRGSIQIKVSVSVTRPVSCDRSPIFVYFFIDLLATVSGSAAKYTQNRTGGIDLSARGAVHSVYPSNYMYLGAGSCILQTALEPPPPARHGVYLCIL